MNHFNGAILIAVLALAPAVTYADGSGGTERYVEVRGAKLYTEIYGRGPPIVFLHGGMAFFDISFPKQRDYFATYRTVVGIDRADLAKAGDHLVDAFRAEGQEVGVAGRPKKSSALNGRPNNWLHIFTRSPIACPPGFCRSTQRSVQTAPNTG